MGVGGGGIPSDYLVSTQLQLWLFCCWGCGCGCCWAVTKIKGQYLKIKDWVSTMLQKLVLGGTSQSEKSDAKVAMVTLRESQQDKNQQNNDNGSQRRGGRQQRQDNRNKNNRNNAPRNQVTECGLCNIIQGNRFLKITYRWILIRGIKR